MTNNKKVINGLGVLSGYAKYLPILALAAVLTALAVTSFCTHTPENCADGQELKPGMFCFDNKAWSKCSGNEYNPYAQFCSASGALYDKCGGKDDYDPLREFCSGNKVVSKCGNATFDPVTQGCVSGIVKEQCGNNHFDPNNEFCFQNTRIYDKCNGKQFDPTIDVCVEGEAVKPKCGTGNYDIDTQFCYNNYVYKKCNGSDYNPAESFCDGGVQYALCGGQKYDPSRQTCNGRNIIDIAEFTVYFNANGGMDGSDPPKTVKANPGKVITIPGQQTLSRNGYSFGGWNTSPSGAGTYYMVNDQYTVTGNVTLYVRWIPIRTITFDGNGLTSGDPPEPVLADSGTAIRLPNNRTLVRAGYSFGGWNTNNTGTGIGYRADSAYTVTINVTLFARWIPIYSVTFNGNNQTSGDPPEPMLADSGTTITLPGNRTLAKTGYIFGGWNTNNAGTGIRYNADSAYTVTGNVILYAMWMPTLTIDVSPMGGGSVNRDPNLGSYINGASVTVTAAAASGYAFIGWSGASTSITASITITMNGAKTLTANFVQYSMGTFTDSRDSKTYKTVTIGGKTWMAENLNYQISDNSWCYGSADSNCIKYGRLYAWNTAMTVCPTGWRLPSREEWGGLAIAVGGTGTYGTGGTAGTILKATSGWNSNGNGTDAIGFSALPGGGRRSNGSFYFVGYNGGWWTATEDGSSNADYRGMNYGNDSVYEDYDGKSYAYSVRCVQD